MTKQPIGVDIDGTLVRFLDKHDAYKDSLDIATERFEMNKPLVERINSWFEEERPVFFITGRGADTFEATLDQLISMGIRFPRNGKVALIMQDEWQGWEAYIRFKADHLRDFGVIRYYGDTTGDEEACRRAGIPFVNCKKW